jgi:hypothetical protein
MDQVFAGVLQAQADDTRADAPSCPDLNRLLLGALAVASRSAKFCKALQRGRDAAQSGL